MTAKSDKDTYLEFWGYTLGTPEAEEAWVKKQEMTIRQSGIQIMGDQHYDGMQATDGTDISTRSKHREYMRRNGLATFDDYKETFQKQQEARDAYHSGQRGTVNRNDIHRAIDQLMGR